MRIQHNIAAMNAYRNYSNNTSAVSKNLEKLSSGYKINRAGDDAAGLAISEKMRAQITGLETAQKNAKDGISLVKTAEGALQEVHDMLNRMVTLATQSANGTYDNETDRAQLQKEVDQLKTEINRIADSSNFNGIKLLDGSMDADGRRVETKTIFSGLLMGSNVHVDTAETDGVNKGFGNKNDKKGLELTGVDLSDLTKTEHTASDASVRYHKDAVASSKTTFTVDLDNTDYETATAGTSIKGLVFGLKSVAPGGEGTKDSEGETISESAAPGQGNVLFLDKDGSKRVTYNVTADDKGITSENIAKSIMKTIDEKGSGKVFLKVGAPTADSNGAKLIEYTVTRDGNKLRFEMTDDGYNEAAKAAEASKAASKKDNYFQGNFNFGVNYKKIGTPAATENDVLDKDSTDEAVKTEIAFTQAVVSKQQHEATSNINEGTTPAGTIYAEALIRFKDDAGAVATGTNNEDGQNKTSEIFKDGAGIQLGDNYYIFAKSDEVYNIKYADNVKVVDLRDLNKLGSEVAADADKAKEQLRLALDRISVAAKDNEMFNVQVAKDGNALVVTERSTYTGDANLTMKNRGLESQIQKFDSASSATTVLKEAGKALNLQIGDTSESFNQMKVNIKDIHTDSLGIKDLDISTQEGASAAINAIKSAINYVSDVRGTLGATQNRLEHTINNLSVMTENIQDAESTIRDTDVAAEMMKYTKNNILVQSAQAMLAQANQIPQGVLQLLG